MPQVLEQNEKDHLKSSLDSLRESEALKAHLLETSRDCVKILDLDARLLYMNEGGMAVLEICDLGPVIGSSWIDFWDGEDKVAAAAAVEQARRGEVGRFVGYFPTTQTRQPRWWDVAVSAIDGMPGQPARLLAVSRDVTELKLAQRALERVGLEQAVLLDINRTITRHLERDQLYGALATCLKEVVPSERFGIQVPTEDGAGLQGHYLSLQQDSITVSNQPLIVPRDGAVGTWVVQHKTLHVSSTREALRAQFPVTFDVLSNLGMESLIALPLVSGERALGTLFFMASAQGAYEHLHRRFLEQVANAVAVALDNCLAHEALREQGMRALDESEERFRDLFDEAPIAYVNEGLDSKFIRANITAMKTLGITPDEVDGTYGKNFIPDTPDAQRRLKEAFDSIGKGIDTSGVVLELRRRDNGKPLWIRWWSRPAPDGTYTRTMFIDITEQVLMEQEKERLEAQSLYLQEEIQLSHNFEELVGSSASLKKVLSSVERVAGTDSTVLITGETGTGKELIARAIHNLSPRKARALIKVNCAAIPAGLIESELFGHEKGAFTGALAKRIGRFELADKGTIFLDEIGELSPDVQAKLLRVLQEGEFERVGGAQTLKVNVRVIAATNRDLAQLAKSGHYRPDLYYRLNVFPLHLPPLRDREGDLRQLAQYFVQKYANEQGKKIERIPERMWTQLQRYHWPGNVRELQHVMERAVILTDGPELVAIDWLESPTQPDAAAGIPTLEELEREHIVRVLDHANWRVSGAKGAAAMLGLKATTLEARMKKLGIQRSART